MYEQKLSCPNCQNDILFDVHAMLQGKSFVCSCCNAKVQLSGESKGLVSKSITDFNKLKNNVLKTGNNDKIR